MNNEEQQVNLKGRINGSNLEAEGPKPNSEADLRGFQKSESNKPKKKIILGIIGGLAVILVGAVVVLAAGIWNPVWNPFQASPDKVLAEAFENMIAIDTIHSKIIYNMDVQAKESFSTSLVIEGDSDATEINTNVFVEGMEMFFDGEMRSIDEVLYFKMGTMPLPFSIGLSQLAIDVSDSTNKWFKFDSKELGMSLIKTLSNEEKAQMEQEIIQLLSDHRIVLVAEKLADEKIEGQNAYHYLLALDKENIKQFLKEFLEMVNKYYEFDDLMNMPEADKQEMSDGIDEFFEATGGIDFEIWIGKKDKLIYRVAGEKSFDLSEIEIEEMEAEEGMMSLDFVLSFSKFNEPVEILAPDDSQSIIEMLMPLMQMFMGGGDGGGIGLPGYEMPIMPTEPTFPEIPFEF